MTLPSLSSNTQAILLLTAPLIAGNGTSSSSLLSHNEYRKLARRLHEMQLQPANLLVSNAIDLQSICQGVVEESRVRRLLERGFLLSQVIERWQARAIWVISRADASYPRRLKNRLREDAPALLYGCGPIELLETGGLAVVGSRHVGEVLIESTLVVGKLTARAGKTLISGGAKGIDQAAMRGALEAGGNAIGVLADGLEKTALKREHRNLLMEGQLVLISPYDPSAGFNVGHAMQRNKVIYGLADVSLVMSSDFNRGGTWAGATEQLEHFRLVPVYVRSTGEASEGLEALRRKGAISWPNPETTEEFKSVLETSISIREEATQAGLPLPCSNDEFPSAVNSTSDFSDIKSVQQSSSNQIPPVAPTHENRQKSEVLKDVEQSKGSKDKSTIPETVQPELAPSEVLFSTVRQVAQLLLVNPIGEAELASTLQVSPSQARAWLRRLIDEGIAIKHKKPMGYITKQSPLFERKN
jgi:DNA processing protein